MWITCLWYSLCLLGIWNGVTRAIPEYSEKSVLMRKTIVINTLLILGYYLVLQLLIWISMVLR